MKTPLANVSNEILSYTVYALYFHNAPVRERP
jgi:hypothetical protein